MVIKKGYLLIGIVMLAALLRFVFLGSNPPSLTWDETAWGYNAYSLGIDGKDEFGKFLPITYIESFGDFKPPVYAYLDILPVKIFGLNEFATRFPSAFFGTLTVLLTYFLVKALFGEKKENLALVSAFILAISPWHIMLSRAAFEANVATFFIVFGILMFLKSLSKPYLLSLSVVSFFLSMNTFNSARIVVPILVVILAFAFHKTLLKNLKNTIFAGLLGLILVLPLFLFLQTPQAKLRFDEVNIFSDINVIKRINQEVQNDNNAFWSKIIHNRRLTYGVEYLRHYFDNLTPSFLFIRGDGNPKFSIQDVGQMYIWEIPFIVAGLILLFRRREKNWWLVPTILLVGIIPAGFARETPHALRIESALPAFQILSAIGVCAFMELILKIKKKKFIYLSLGIFTFAVFINFAYFIQTYLYHYPSEFSAEWQYGYRDSISFVSTVKDKYSAIYATEALGRPYIYYLFYLKYAPSKFRDEASVYREALGFVHVRGFSNFHFTDKISSVRDKNALYISTSGEKPENVNVIKEFKLLNGRTSLVAYTL